VNTRQTLLFILLLVVIIGSGWFLDGRHGGLQDLSVSRTGPDAFVSAMHLDVMDAGGFLRYRVTADHMTHYPSADQLELQHPLIDLQQRNGNTWRISAETGETSDSGDLIRLLGKVDIHRSGISGPLQVRTRDLLVKPEQAYATTDSAASITAPGYRVDTVGLEADLGSNTLELRNRVRGSIDAPG
jgi:lipopolysaccharide export system protein LptC